MMRMRGLAFISMLACAAAHAQEVLTLDEAVRLARERNGTIRSAFADLETSESRVRQAFGAFLPEITPVLRYDNRRNEVESFVTKTDEWSTQLGATWRILDAGQRSFSHRAAQRLAGGQRANTKQTLREILFSVHEQFFNALRSQELVRVRDASIERANELMKATQAQIDQKVAPAKDILQARADYLNAKVDQLDARNQLTTTQAGLKAVIGWEQASRLPALQTFEAPESFGELPPLQDVIAQGLANREDLRSTRFSIEAQKLNIARAARDAGVSWSLDANYTRQFSETEQDSRNLTFLISVPLFDGSQSKEIVRQARLNLEALHAGYEQQQRNVSAEIESAYLSLQQDRERLGAAKAALDAAKENYTAASEAQRLGAEGTNIITVLTAKISLVTAESNYVNAVYDVYVSEVRLRLATGQSIPGEER